MYLYQLFNIIKRGTLIELFADNEWLYLGRFYNEKSIIEIYNKYKHNNYFNSKVLFIYSSNIYGENGLTIIIEKKLKK